MIKLTTEQIDTIFKILDWVNREDICTRFKGNIFFSNHIGRVLFDIKHRGEYNSHEREFLNQLRNDYLASNKQKI